MLYATGSNIYCIGGIPVGHTASAEPPTPPTAKFPLVMGGVPGSISGAASYKKNGTYYQYIPSSDASSASGNFTLAYGTYVSISLWASSYQVVGDIGISGLSATGSSERLPVYEWDEFGNSINITGYLTSTGFVMAESPAKPKKFFISASAGTTSMSLTASGAGNGNAGAGLDGVRMPFRYYSAGATTGGYFPSSCIVTRKTSTLGNTAKVFEPIGCSAVSFSANVKQGGNEQGWTVPDLYTTFNFSGGYFSKSTFHSTGTATASGTITANLYSAFINNLSSRNESSTALGFSAKYMADGSKTTGYFSALSWSATGIAK